MSSKRNRVVLTLKEKSEIVNALDRGETYSSLCDKYSIGKASIYDIKKKGEIIRSYSRKVNEEIVTSKRKVMKPSKLEEVEQALYVWFVQNCSAGNPVSDPLLFEKALCFAAVLNADPMYMASQGICSRMGTAFERTNFRANNCLQMSLPLVTSWNNLQRF
uniref:HTH psq-type domain-containing protein n=1 Tax=Trichuris muris TaxID=70415 RepID=A0A5S6QKG1_TRIMR